MVKVNLTINGKLVAGNQGQTILEVAKDNNIFIPTLCNDERVKPFGSCLICRVEVEGARGNMLACATPITEGMVVRTESDGIKEARKMCLELLVSQHHGDCTAPCSMTCPAEIDVQGYIALIANGQYKEAIKLIKERNPLPLVCGRVCTRPCEDECRRNLVDERVGIDYLKRFVADYDIKSTDPYRPEVMSKTGKKVAVIGAGPSGLSCANYLAVLGHDVTIFEKWPKGGGMLRYGIPEYRLPREALEKEIELIKDLGVEIRYNTTFGKDVTHSDLRESGYEAIFLGVGSQKGQPLGVENEELSGVMTGVDFLGEVNLKGDIDFTSKKVVVIGGGNTAVDAARTSVRLNAAEVVLAYRRTRAEMPAHEMEIEEAEFEGVSLELLAAPKGLVGNEGAVSGVKFVRMQLGEPDATGRRKPEEIMGSDFIMEADVVITAIGQTQDLSFLNSDFTLETSRNRILINEDLMTTNLAGVFAGGDAVTGPDAAISAIAAGRRAAVSINKYLNGEKLEKEISLYNHTKGKLKSQNPSDYEKYEKIKKERMPLLSREQRALSFKEVELGFSEEQAMHEAKRCLSCGCKDVNECKLRDYSTQFEVDQNRLLGEIDIHPIDDSHEYITRDPNKCIMCGLCVRICSEQQGAGVMGFNARGYSTVITPSFEMPFGEDNRCEKCGQCVSACPVGALVEKTALVKPGPFKEKLVETTCSGCGTGCSITLHTVGDLVVRRSAKVGKGLNNGNLCEMGRFKEDVLSSASGLEFPLIRKGDKLEKVSWNEAIDYVSNKLIDIVKVSGENSIGVVVTPEMTNEELRNARKLAKETIKTSKFGCSIVSEASIGLEKSIGKGFGEATFADINEADFIVCAGFDIKKDNPVAALFVQKAALNGAKLFIVNNEETKLARYADRNYILNNCDMVDSISSSEGEISKEYKKAKKALFIIGDSTSKDVSAAIGDLISKNSGSNREILLMHRYSNMRGIIETGANTLLIPSEEMRAMIFFNEDVYDGLDASMFKIQFANNLDLENINSDVIFPAEDSLRIEGTVTNSEGKSFDINKIFDSKYKYNTNEIIEKINSKLEGK